MTRPTDEPPGANPLELDAETMRRMGYRAVDLLVERIAGIGAQPAWKGAGRAAMEARLREAPPAAPAAADPAAAFDALLDRLAEDVLEFAGRVDHPRFFAFVSSCPTWPGILGDFIAGGASIFQGTWLESAGASQLELVVLDWFKEWVGYPAAAAGLLTSGGSAANLTALACARENSEVDGVRATLYLSAEAHSSMRRAARVLGFREDQVRTLPTDAARRVRLDALADAVGEDRRAGRSPFFVAANAGATSTGAIDPLPELAAFCEAERLWLHVDGAYGGFAALTDRGRSWLGGMERADSLTLDPHKWLYQPYEAGCLLVRRGELLPRAFHIMPDYLQDTAVGEGAEVNFADRGVQLTRSARALKIWLSVQLFGVDAFRAAIDRCLDLALAAERRVRESPRLELLSPASLGILCFRRVPDASGDEADLERLNARLVAGLSESGEGMISSTRVGGRYALRLCILNHRSTAADVDRVLDWLERAEPRPS